MSALSPISYVDIDRNGNMVSMTIEHASTAAKLPVVRIEEIGAVVA